MVELAGRTGKGEDSTKLNTPSTLGEIITIHKQTYAEHPPSNYLAYLIDPSIDPIAPEELRDLAFFPYEFAIHEVTGRTIIVNIGEPTSVNCPPGRHGTLCIHSHPQDHPDSPPSLHDLIQTLNDHPETQHMLITQESLTVYGRPQQDPVTKGPMERDFFDAIREWERQRGVTFSKHMLTVAGLKDVYTLPVDEQNQIVRDFAMASGMVRVQVPWSETATIGAILDVINLRASNIPMGII